MSIERHSAAEAAALAEANEGEPAPGDVPSFEGRPLAPWPETGAHCLAIHGTSGYVLLLARLADETTLFRLLPPADVHGLGAEVAGADMPLSFQELVLAARRDAPTDRALKVRRVPVGGVPTFVIFVGQYHRAGRGVVPSLQKKFTRIDARVELRPLGPAETAAAVAAVHRRSLDHLAELPGDLPTLLREFAARAERRAGGGGEGAPPAQR